MMKMTATAVECCFSFACRLWILAVRFGEFFALPHCLGLGRVASNNSSRTLTAPFPGLSVCANTIVETDGTANRVSERLAGME